MTDNASRRGAADLTMPLMVLAFLVMGGFMYWLYGEAMAENAIQAIVEEEAAVVSADIEGATTVDPVDIQLDPTPYEGQVIRLADGNILSMLGTQGFWLEMPNGNPFLVSLNDELIAEGLPLAMGELATVAGMVIVMTPDLAQSWLDAGTIPEGDKLAAEFATHYLAAQVVQVGGGSSGSIDSGEEAADSTAGNEGAEGN